MSGRAVGGAAGAGCGAFTILGVLVAVVVAIWLSSQVIGGGGGGNGDGGGGGAPSNDDIAQEALDALRDGTAVPGSVDAGRDIQLSPPTGYAPGTTIKVSGSGFEGEVQVLTCIAGEPRSAAGSAACDLGTVASATPQADGMLLLDYQARGSITVLGEAFDCTTAAGACEVVASPPGHPDAGVTVALAFGG